MLTREVVENTISKVVNDFLPQLREDIRYNDQIHKTLNEKLMYIDSYRLQGYILEEVDIKEENNVVSVTVNILDNKLNEWEKITLSFSLA